MMTSKALLVREILKFQLFKCHDVTKWQSMKQNILLSNLGSKHSLVIEFDQCTRFSKEW